MLPQRDQVASMDGFGFALWLAAGIVACGLAYALLRKSGRRGADTAAPPAPPQADREVPAQAEAEADAQAQALAQEQDRVRAKAHAALQAELQARAEADAQRLAAEQHARTLAREQARAAAEQVRAAAEEARLQRAQRAARENAERAALQAAQEAQRLAAEQAAAQAAAQAAERAAEQAARLETEPVALPFADQAGQAAARPAALASDRAVARAPAAPKPPELTLVMVADDSKTVRVKTGRLLARHHYQVAYAADGLQAVEQIRAQTPDVVITDVEMPGMDGFELTRQLRENAVTAHLPVIMITSANDRHGDEARKAGVSVLLGKPYADEELIAHVRQALHHEPTQAGELADA